MKEKDIQDTAKRQGRGNSFYQVGRNKPPQWCQWRPGESGNVKGRRKGAISLEAALRRYIRANPRQAQTLIDSVFAKAINGDVEHLKLIFTIDKLNKF